MIESFEILHSQLTRQVAHWTTAASRLADLESLASANAWAALGGDAALPLRRQLMATVEHLRHQSDALRSILHSTRTVEDVANLYRRLVSFRRDYLRTEKTFDFFADAVNTRTNPVMGASLRACDILARRSMSELLEPLGKTTPPVLTYVDKGLGASILKAGLKMWDARTENPVAAIKITRHALSSSRPTALAHEAGHQSAHLLNWNEELAEALQSGLADDDEELADAWAGWSSELAADAQAFATLGYAAVAGLHDVLSGSETFVFRHTPGDPHPISYVRVLLGTQMCSRFFGKGPWDDMDWAWKHLHPLENAPAETRRLLSRSLPLLPKIVEIILLRPFRAFNGRPLVHWLDPQRVTPSALLQLETIVGPALFNSAHWLWREPLRLLALSGYRIATTPDQVQEILGRQKNWLTRLGSVLQAA